MDSTPAILLRKTKLTETSLIVSWLTPAGRIKTVAKGARSARSRFAGSLDLFYQCEIQVARSRRSDLHILREVVLREPYVNLRLDYRNVLLGGYLVELLELVTEPEDPAPELFDLLQRALGFLNTHPPTRRALEHFEDELARLLGVKRPDTTGMTALSRVYHQLPPARKSVLAVL